MKTTDLVYFRALTDVFLNSINRQNYALSETISRFIYGAFLKEREKSKNKPVEYPNDYYELIYKTIDVLATQSNKRNSKIAIRTAGSIWLLGELSSCKISEKTYSWIWRNLLLALEYNRDDMVFYHWETAHQYISHTLRNIEPEYDYSSKDLLVLNLDQIEVQTEARSRFLEFHYALGGLLLYSETYDIFRQMFNYTTRIPPKYELLPDSMDEIFKFYNKIRDPYEMRYPWISDKYPFPKQSGLNSDSEIKKWISSYMALLFLRQYSIQSHLITIKPFEYPEIPKTQGEIKQWIEGLDSFKDLVSEHLQNYRLLEITKFDFITEEWCQKNDVLHPLEFIDSFKKTLKEKYEQNKITIKVANDKKNLFYESTKEIIESTFEKYKPIINPENIKEDTDKWYISGVKMLQNKDAYAENPEADYTNYYSILASGLSDKINYGFVSTFLNKKTNTYLLKPEDIFQGIDKLKIDENYAIICFGINIDYFREILGISNLSENKYKNIRLYLFDNLSIANSSIFILKETNLPNLSTTSINPQKIEKYSLEKLSDSLNLYASIIDLNDTTPELMNESKKDMTEEELRKSVLLSIIISVEITWKKNIEMIHIQQYSKYRQEGLPDKPNKIKPTK